MSKFDLREVMQKRGEQEINEDEWPLYNFCYHQKASIPISYVPLDYEFQKEPFFPLNYGVRIFPFAQASRDEVRSWTRNCFSKEYISIERQIDISTHIWSMICYPFSKKTGLQNANKLIQHGWKDDFLESLGKDSVEIGK